MKKVALICLILFGCSIVMGATFKAANPFGNWDQLKKIVYAVGAFYKGCEDERATVVMAELAIVDLAKKSDKDAVPYLEKALEELKEPGLRNFTMFLIANCHKEKGDTDKALEQLLQIIKEQ